MYRRIEKKKTTITIKQTITIISDAGFKKKKGSCEHTMGNSNFGKRGQQNRTHMVGNKTIFQPNLDEPEESPAKNAVQLSQTNDKPYMFGELKVMDFSGHFPADFESDSLFRIHVLGRHIQGHFLDTSRRANDLYEAMVPYHIVTRYNSNPVRS